MAKFTAAQFISYTNSRDPYLWAFQHLLNCSEQELTDFINLVNSQRTVIDPVFLWAAQAIEAMADNNG